MAEFVEQPGTPGARARRGWRLLLACWALYTLAVCIIVAVRADEDPARGTSDFRDYWRTALHFRETGEISSDLGVHNYLPFFAIFMTPWSLLPLRVAIVLFTLLSMALLALTIVLVERVLNERGGPPRPATLLTIGLLLPYIHSSVVLGTVGLLLLFLVIATWYLVERGQEWPAGLTLGLAVLIKLLPAVLVVYFLLKRRWRVAAAAGAVCLILGLGAPLASLGYTECKLQHAAFLERAAEGQSAYVTIFAEKPRKAKYSNNAVPIVLRRLLSHANGDPNDDGDELYVNIAEAPAQSIWLAYLALIAAFVAASAGAALRGNRVWPPDSPRLAAATRFQFAAWCALMLLASPLVWTHYLVLMYWPIALAADRVEHTTRQRGRACRPALLALGAWLVGAALLAWPAARAAGAQLAAVTLVWTAAVYFGWTGATTGGRTTEESETV